MNLSGKRVAVAGMGVSGRAIAAACRSLGAIPTVFDEMPADSEQRVAVVDELEAAGTQVVTAWHGHLQVDEFDLFVTSPGFRRTHPSIQDALRGGLEVISEVEFAFRIANAPVVAITGTNGKSTVTVMTWSLLRAAGVEAVLCGNIAGSGYDEVALTSAAADSKPEQVLVAEISSYQLEWVSQFRPRVAAITNLSPDHGDRHPSIEDYYQTKMRIFAAMSDGDTAVVNGSGQLPTLDQIEAALPAGVGLRVFGPAGSDRGHPTAESTSWTKDEIVLGGRRIDRRQLPLFGEINVINACMAWELAAGFLGGIGDKTAERMIGALADFRGLRHRMEVLGERGGVLVLNNSMCTNPQAVIQSSRALPRRHVLLMGGANKELDYRPVGDYLRETRVRAVLFGQGQAWLLEQLGCDCPIHADLKDAFLAAVEMAKPGEAVMLAPGLRTSFPYKDFMDRGEAFRAIAKEWLES